jgi:hypothetical protein
MKKGRIQDSGFGIQGGTAERRALHVIPRERSESRNLHFATGIAASAVSVEGAVIRTSTAIFPTGFAFATPRSIRSRTGGIS